MVDVKIQVVNSDKFTDKLKQDKESLEKEVFVDIDEKETKEDFYNPGVAGVFAYLKDELIGYTGIHVSKVKFEGKMIKLGGYGVGVREDMRRQGIATRMCQEAMKYLMDKRCDIGFLSIDLSKTWADKLHKKIGFIHFPRKFTWKNIHGEIKKNDGGMIALLGSREKFNKILKGQNLLYVGEGYW